LANRAQSSVENLLMHGAFPVERKTAKYFFCEIANDLSTNSKVHRPSYFVSLVSQFAKRRIAAPRFQFPEHYLIKFVRHCFERIIAGRPFVIEVTWVADKRWRAHIVRIPGVPTAMMPFYGETPDEAASHLTEWLDQAHHQANTV
jgi:predicted RNase H-like HicB family nuclease